MKTKIFLSDGKIVRREEEKITKININQIRQRNIRKIDNIFIHQNVVKNMKRGISAVVATILIVLISISAISIVWVYILPMIKNSADASQIKNIGGLSIEESGYTFYDEEKKVACVQIQREDISNIEKIKVIFLINGSTKNFEVPPFGSDEELPLQNQKKTYCFNLSEYGIPESVEISPIFKSGLKNLK